MKEIKKIAVISDIHGNLTALQAVLSDIERRGIESIYCLGDIVGKGYHSRECLELAQQRCEVIVRGNHEDSREALRDLFPFCHEFYLSGRLVRLLHSHPVNMTANEPFAIYADSRLLYSMFEPSERTVSEEVADIVVFGHIHVPYLQRIYHRVLLNAGSVGDALEILQDPEQVGNALNTTCASYLILAGVPESRSMEDPISYEFVSVPYDIEKELAGHEGEKDFEAYAAELREGKYRDMEKIRRGIKAFAKANSTVAPDLI